MTKPIKPSEVSKTREASIPDEIIEIFNELITKDWDGDSATVNQNTAVALASKKLNMSRQDIFDKHYMDVEGIFRKAGWVVEYDKPGYNETYDATFKFSKRQ